MEIRSAGNGGPKTRIGEPASVPGVRADTGDRICSSLAHEREQDGGEARARRLRDFLALSAVALALTGCSGAPMADDAAQPAPAWEPPAPRTTGAIWRDGGNGLALFGDRKAHAVGDVLTILLDEQTQASSSAATQLKKDDSIELSAPSVFGAPVTHKGKDIIATELSGGREFSGSGDSTQSNRLSGQLTVTIIARLPNGNLQVRGQKRLRLNQGDETVRVEGVVRPADISPDNTISSARVADARISYEGRGSLGDANAQGWLSRVFNSRWMPF